MLISLDEKVFVKSLFYLEYEEGNFLGFLFEEGGINKFNYRFRHFNPESEDPFDCKDEKSFYSVTSADSSIEEMLVKVRVLLKMLTGKTKTNMLEIEINKKGDDPGIVKTLKGLPMFHVKKET